MWVAVGESYGWQAKGSVPDLKGPDNVLKSGKPTRVNPARVD
jgi:hypothetical protein